MDESRQTGMDSAGNGSDDWWNPDLEPEEFRRLGYQAVDMIADYFGALDELPVFPGKSSEEIARVFAEPLPQQGSHPDEVLQEWSRRVLPNSTHVGSPRYFGYVNGSGTMIGVLADALAASVNMNPGGWKPGPSATEIERRTIAWIAEMIGYPSDCGGLLTSGGTMANYTGIMTGLRNTAQYDTTAEGLQSGERNGRFLIYMADHEGHVSIKRVADLLNLGRSAVRRVPSRADFTMDPEALQRMIAQDKVQGDHPFCVVAQVGSINVGAIDPLEAIADVCEENRMWFHADGACGAVGAVLPEKRELYAGLERADSVTLDPHKWLFLPYECGCLLVQDPEKLRRSFSMTAPYLRGTLPTEYTGQDYFEYGPQMSRGFRALKVWMTLKHYGVEGYRRLLSQGVRCAEHLDHRVQASKDFERLHAPTLYIYSFSYAPQELQEQANGSRAEQERVESALDWMNQRIADEIQARGTAFIMTSRVHGRTVLRMSICSHRTTLEHIDTVFDALAEIGREAYGEWKSNNGQ